MITWHTKHMRAAITGVWLMTLTVACQPIAPDAPGLSTPNGVIFTAAQTETTGAAIPVQTDGAWTPSNADVAQLEQDLLPFLQQAQHPWLRADPPIWERVPDYKRQYLGLTVAGERVIYANFFCRVDAGEDWQREYVFVLDGGDCYFRVMYNPTTREFSRFDVNGES